MGVVGGLSVACVCAGAGGRALLAARHPPGPVVGRMRVPGAVQAQASVVASPCLGPAPAPRMRPPTARGVPQPPVGPGTSSRWREFQRPQMRSMQHLTSNGPRVRTDKYGSQCSNGYQFARRCSPNGSQRRAQQPRNTNPPRAVSCARLRFASGRLASQANASTHGTWRTMESQTRLLSLRSTPFRSARHQAHALPHRAAKHNRGTAPKRGA